VKLEHPAGTVIVEGSVATPGPSTWSCPSCRRTRVVELEQQQRRHWSVTCAGDPVTGALHPPAAMVSDRLPAVRR